MGKNKPRHNPPQRSNPGVSVRGVGCKGTDITFVPTKDGCKVLVEDSTAKDEGFLSKEDLRYLLGSHDLPTM